MELNWRSINKKKWTIVSGADRTEEDGWLCLRCWVHLVQELSGDGEAGARTAHREEEVVVGVGAQHGDRLVLVSAVITILSFRVLEL